MRELEAVAGIICCEDEILCLKRPEGSYESSSKKYEFPGGKMEIGETKIEALKRELMEELEIEVEILEEFLTVNQSYPNLKLTRYSYLCRVNDKKFVMTEHEDFKWLKKEELAKLDWSEADLLIVEKLMK